MIADPKLLEFLCPLCGSNVALCVHVESRSGVSVRMPFYKCAGCTVLFGDIQRFKRQMRHTYDTEHHRVDEKPMIGDGAVPYWSPVAKSDKS